MTRPKTLRFGLMTLAAVLAMAGLAALGCWQLGRAGHKLALQSERQARQALPVLDSAELLQAGDWLHRKISLRGQWLPEATVFLENRQMHGRVGFFVFTPLLLEGRQEAVLVQRGWAARDFLERSRLPFVATPEGVVQVTGRVAGEPAQLYEFAQDPLKQGFSRIRQNLQLSAYSAEFSLTLLPQTVVQTGAASEGLERDWLDAGSGVEKHYGYAFQWFALCALVAMLYVWFQLIRPRRERRSRAP